MKRVLSLVIAASIAAATGASAGPEKSDKDELLTLYLLTVAADRCAFAMSAKQADAIDREAKILVEKMKLGARENDAIYSEADVAFEKQGPSACDRNGKFAKGFQLNLKRVTSP